MTHRWFAWATITAAGAMVGVSACTHAPRSRQASQVVVSEVARFDQDQCTGVAVSRKGRVFASFPLWHDGHRIHVAEVFEDGTYAPYPNESWNSWRESGPVAGEQFVCVQSVYTDDTDRLWVLDPANPRMRGVVPDGAFPKLVMFDLSTNTPTRTYDLSSVAPAGSYLNDVRIDTLTGHAFMTDSSLGGLVVLDLNSGTGRRVLAEHPATKAEPDVIPIVGGRELRFAGGPNQGQVPQVHSDGIAFDPVRRFVYWQALTSRTLYRLPAEALIDASLADAALAASIENLGPTVMTDGMEVDARGNVYFSAIEESAVVVRTPDGKLHTLARAELLSWPDSFALGPGGSLYVTTAQIHKTSWFTPDGSMPTTPYRIFRMMQWP